MHPELVQGPFEEIARAFVRRMEQACETAVRDRGECSVALPGGSVAERLLPELVTARIEWSRLRWFWVDERAVPPTDVRSNYRLGHERILARIPADPDRIHRIPAEEPNLTAVAHAYEKILTGALGDPPRLDVAILGFGEDGHVASVFPVSASRPRPLKGWVAPVPDSPRPPAGRVTLTLQTLKAARSVFLAGFGPGKRDVVRRAWTDPDFRAPLAILLRSAPAAVLFAGD